MPAKVLTVDGAKEASINLTEGDKGHHAIHSAVVTYQANRRQGNACTKSRAEVSGSGKKLWRQKGTGRARIGSVRAPHWRGGGIVFGPKPRDYSKKINRKVKHLALRAAITARINDGDVLVIPNLAVSDGKTKSFVKTLRDITEARKVLILAPQFDEATLRSARNVDRVDLMRASDVNCENLLNYDKVVVTSDALQTLAQRTAAD